MRKKLVALFLGSMMAVSLLAGCGGTASDGGDGTGSTSPIQTEGDNGEAVPEEADGAGETDRYAETVSFTMTGVNTEAGVDYGSSAVGQCIRNKFNVEFEVLPNGVDGAKERFAIEATSGELADMNMWLNFDWSTYYEYVDQGLFAPLPEDWKERWPNLGNMVEKSGYLESLEVDGRTYGFLHSVYGMLTDVGVATAHTSLYMRTDLADQVGMEGLCEDGTITISELKEYLQKVKAAGLVETPVLGGPNNEILLMFRRVLEFRMTTFILMVIAMDGCQIMKIIRLWFRKCRSGIRKGCWTRIFTMIRPTSTRRSCFSVGKFLVCTMRRTRAIFRM